MKISADYASHLPILTKIVDGTNGSILELGVGIYSTPYLHWSCFPTKRRLVSWENSEKYVQYFKSFRTDFHEINFINDWDRLPIDQMWEVAFIDHAPDARRGIEAKRLANTAKYLILHDSEPSNDKLYGYSQAYPFFKYRFDYTNAYPNTTVLSNFVDLTNLNNV